jgi:hypothetical protein
MPRTINGSVFRRGFNYLGFAIEYFISMCSRKMSLLPGGVVTEQGWDRVLLFAWSELGLNEVLRRLCTARPFEWPLDMERGLYI